MTGAPVSGTDTPLSTTAVVLAGGSGVRVGAPLNKVYLPVAGKPLIRWSLDAFDRTDEVRAIVLVVRPQDRQLAADALGAPPGKLRAVVDGGATRHASERAGLRAVQGLERTHLVLVHDGARPVVSPGLLARLLRAALGGGAVPGIPFQRHVVRTDDGVARPIDARQLRRVQTPQVFDRDVLLQAYEAAPSAFAGLDTCDTVQRYSQAPVRIVDGDMRNVKVTYADDLPRVAALLAQPDAARS